MKLPPIRTPYPHVHASPHVLGGSPCVRWTRIPVCRLWDWYRKGVTIDRIVERTRLAPAEVLCALAFAYDNPEVIEADLVHERGVVGEANEHDDVPPESGVTSERSDVTSHRGCKGA